SVDEIPLETAENTWKFLLEFERSSLASYSPYRDKFLHRAIHWGRLAFSSQGYLSAAVWRLVMATQPLIPVGLKLQLEQKPNETIVHCKGRITVENSEVFQKEIRDLIAESRDQIAAKTYRIVLDLSNVTHVDSTGLGALLGLWTAAQKK